ncbi:hypothetical protein PsYK624_095240 [Phanerochaete sordida]|uniref:Fungal-type protein kinase domain-containing protein n=1 Tax=Phanerochaete sordida TaxID=48140 RepID=A0A9P3GEJ3_9APHY|nr:hypothetical protein PsYK624_095240 [Phanerochaete sordida]
MTLAQVDGLFVELPLDDFKSLIPGEDLSTEQLKTLPKFRFLKKLDNEHQKYNPLCQVFDVVEELAETSNRWKNIAHYSEDKRTDHRPDIGSYCDALDDAVIAYKDAVKPLKRKRRLGKDPKSKVARGSKRPRLTTSGSGKAGDEEDEEDEDESSDDEDSDSDYEEEVEVIDDPCRARTAWGWLVSFVEVKDTEAVSGFHFKPARGEDGKLLLLRVGEEPEAARAQFVKYFTEATLRQHRTHYFAFYIAGTWVRVFRWDRAGCLVSPAIDLLKEPQVFYNILYRIARSNAWGYDETAVLATLEEVQKLHAYVPPNGNEYLQDYRQLILDYRSFYPIYKISCPVVSMDGSDTHGAQNSYLIGRHIWGHYSPVGRCTRGYIAFDVDRCTLVFFKDQWRCLGRKHTELETYKHLHQHKVQNIALPLAGGDISHQRTLTQDYLTHIPREERHSQRVHTRLVTKQVGLMLETYKDSPELLSILSQALLAHWQAWTLAGVLHRDVSVGNIMIDAETGEGFLNDWDLAKFKKDMDNLVPASEPAGISGTRPFKSALALQYPRKPPEVADDIESFVHVANYMGMRFHWHQYSPKDGKVPKTRRDRDAFNNANTVLVTRVNAYFFDDEPVGRGYLIGGRTKLKAIQTNELPIAFKRHRGNKPLIEQFLTLAWQLLHRHYSELDFDAYEVYAVEETDTAQPDEADIPNPPARPRKPVKLSDIMKMRLADDAGPPPLELPPSPSPSPSLPLPQPSSPPARKFPRPRTGLDHHALNNILFQVCYHPDGTERDLSEYYDDKAFDHFVHQGIITYDPRKGDTGMRFAPKAPNARAHWSLEKQAKETPGRKNPVAADMALVASRSPRDQGQADEVQDEQVPRRRTRGAAKTQDTARPEALALPTIAEDPDDPAPTRHKAAAKGKARGETTAARKSKGASAAKSKGTAPTRRSARKGTPPPRDDAQKTKSAAKASRSRKAEATRRPPSPRKAAPATKAKVTGKSATAPKAAAVRAGRAGKPPSLKPERPETAPTRRSSRLAQKSGKK